MQALRFQSPGDPLEVLSCSEVEIPQPGAGQVLLRMRLATINPSDLLQVRGLYGRKAELPATAGLEGLGVVDALGPGVNGVERGQRVAPLTAQGTWADYLVVPSETLVTVPDGLADESAAQIAVNPLTAWILADELSGQLLKALKPLSTLLVYGALSMEPLQVPGGQLIFKSTTVKGFWLTDWKRHTPKPERDRVLSELLAAMAEGHITPPVEAVYPLSRFREAIPHATLSGRRGKVLLRAG
jgi:NADPH:quinone reductase-like Zn-dependent oxidoreductase